MSESEEQQLWDACTEGNLELVNLLANDLAVNVNWIGPEKGDTPLHRARRFQHLQAVEILLQYSTVDVNANNAGGATPLYFAGQEGHVEVLTMLLADKRVAVNKPSGDGATPFYVACQNGNIEVVSLLLADIRIDVNKPSGNLCTPL